MGQQLLDDEQFCRAVSLHIQNVRKLATWGAVKPATAGGGGRGKVRMWNLDDVSQVGMISAAFHAGFSLRMAHSLVYKVVVDEQEWHRKTGGRPQDWFSEDADKNGRTWRYRHIFVVDGKYCFAGEQHCDYRDQKSLMPMPLGLLSEDRTLLYTFFDYLKYRKHRGQPAPIWDLTNSGESQIDPESLAWEYASHLRIDDKLTASAEGFEGLVSELSQAMRNAWRNPTSVLACNLTLAAKTAFQKARENQTIWSK